MRFSFEIDTPPTGAGPARAVTAIRGDDARTQSEPVDGGPAPASPVAHRGSDRGFTTDDHRDAGAPPAGLLAALATAGAAGSALAGTNGGPALNAGHAPS